MSELVAFIKSKEFVECEVINRTIYCYESLRMLFDAFSKDTVKLDVLIHKLNYRENFDTIGKFLYDEKCCGYLMLNS